MSGTGDTSGAVDPAKTATPAAPTKATTISSWSSPELDVQIDGTTWSFTLNRPDKLNALNAALVDALLRGVDAAKAAGARLLVFRGAGRSFSAGFDLSDLEAQSEAELVLRFVRIELLLQAIGQAPARTLALAHGKVFGAGVDLFAACHERIAAPEAVFRMAGLKFGLVLGTRRFMTWSGPRRHAGSSKTSAPSMPRTRPPSASSSRSRPPKNGLH